MVIEYWQPIPTYEGLYEASSLGNIRSIRSNIILKPVKTARHYCEVRLCKNRKAKNHLVHRLVLQAFKGAAPKPMQANHKNGNKDDNKLENLEWVTCSYNMRHAYRNGLCSGRKGERCNWAKLSQLQVDKIRELIKQGIPKHSIATQFQVHRTTIYRIHHRLRWNI